jgi:Schlafen, AlbA_2
VTCGVAMPLVAVADGHVHGCFLGQSECPNSSALSDGPRLSERVLTLGGSAGPVRDTPCLRRDVQPRRWHAWLVSMWRSPDLESLFSGPLDETGLHEAALDRLIEAGAREGELLDFKAGRYGPTAGPRTNRWIDEQEFAKDVASFANHRGGLLLIGVADEDGVASKKSAIDGVSVEAEERRLRVAALNYMAPPATLIFVPIMVASGGWCLAVVIPPSMRAPHAVLGDPGDAKKPLRYPVRHGADTNWLTESEVAERYRRRFSGAVSFQSRVGKVTSDGKAALGHSGSLWTYIAVVPEAEIDARLDRPSVNSTTEWFHRNSIVSPCGRQLPATGVAIPAPGRMTFTGHRYRDDQDPADAHDAYVALHMSGAAFAASVAKPDATSSDRLGQLGLIDDAVLLSDVCLRWAARQVGAWGEATVIAGLLDTLANGDFLRHPLELAGRRHGHNDDVRKTNTRSVVKQPEATTSADLGAVGSVQQRLVVTRNTLSVLLQEFGIVEVDEFGPEGSIVGQAWGSSWYRGVESWATQYKVDFVGL